MGSGSKRSAKLPGLVAVLWAACWSQLEAGAPATPQRPLVFVQSWDGAPHHVVQELSRRGQLPNLARLRAAGFTAKDGLVPAFPSQTAPGHARLWTGAPERVNGISGNTVLGGPRGEHTILEGYSGFDGSLLKVEPLWITAARQGKDTLVWNAPQSYPSPQWSESEGAELARLEAHLRVVHGYGHASVDSGLLDVSDLGTGSRELQLGAVRAKVWQPVRPGASASRGEASVRVDVGAGLPEPRKMLLRGARAGTAEFSPGLVLPDGSVIYFRLYPFANGGHKLFNTTASPARGNGRQLFEAAVAAGGGMILNGPADQYLEGFFGKTLMDGGGGEAEEIYLDVVQELIELNARSMLKLMEGRRWDLIVNYLPLPDEVLHLWYGYVDKDLAPRNPSLARRIRPLIERVFAMLDAHLGRMLAKLGEQDSVFLVSDHGMEGCDRDLVLNEALRAAGYLALDASGAVDLKRTRAFYGPGTSASVVLNTSDWKQGIVHPEEAPALSEEIGRLIMGLKDPQDGKPLVRGVFLPANNSRDYGGETAGQIYVDAAPGVYLRGGFNAGRLTATYAPAGRHMFHPQRPEMLAILYARSPALKAASVEGPLSQLVLAPTICRILGIEPAATMTGKSLTETASP